jgi:Right handed beta helix region
MMFLRLSPVALAMVTLLTTGATAQAQQRGAMSITGTVTGSGSLAVPAPAANVVSLFVDNSSTYTGIPADNSETQPFKTIVAAVSRANVLHGQSKHVRIIIKPGNGYREPMIGFYQQPKAFDNFITTFEGYLPANNSPKPTLFGSERWTFGNSFGVTTNSKGNPVYYRSSGTSWGEQEDTWALYGYNLPLAMRRRETVTIGGQPLERVLLKPNFTPSTDLDINIRLITNINTITKVADLKPGQFTVVEGVGSTNVNYGKYYICPPLGVAMNAATIIEVGMRSKIFDVTQRKNVIFKDLNFQGSADYFNDGALHMSQCRNVRIENCGFSYNASKGLWVDNGLDYSVINCSFYKNGITGFSGGYVKNLLIDGASCTFNNWRGANGGMGAWDNAGIKMFSIHNSKILNSNSTDNYGDSVGIWLDTDVNNVTVSNVNCLRNSYGLFYEASQGPCLITQSTLNNNRFSGLYDSSGDNLTVNSCTIGNNGTPIYDLNAIDPRLDPLTFNGEILRQYLWDEAQVYILGNSNELPYGGRVVMPIDLVFNNTTNTIDQVPQIISQLGLRPNNLVNTTYIAYGYQSTFTNNTVFWNTNNIPHLLIGCNYGDFTGFVRFQTTLLASGNNYGHKGGVMDVFHRKTGNLGIRSLTEWKLDTNTDANATWTSY